MGMKLPSLVEDAAQRVMILCLYAVIMSASRICRAGQMQFPFCKAPVSLHFPELTVRSVHRLEMTCASYHPTPNDHGMTGRLMSEREGQQRYGAVLMHQVAAT